MPDAFGNLTPQEVLQNIRQQQRARFAQGMTGGPGVQFGTSLGAIFGPTIRKTLETRKARKKEEQYLMDYHGLTQDEARAKAKASIGRQFAAVRRAEDIQEAGSDVQEFIESLPPTIPADMRQGQGMLYMANRLRSMGLVTEANNLATQARTVITAAEKSAAEMENLEARTASTRASTAETLAGMEFIGTTAHGKNIIQRERYAAELRDNDRLTPEQRKIYKRAMDHLDAKMLKDEQLTPGMTEFDVLNDPVSARKLFTQLSDNAVLSSEIDTSINQLEEGLSRFDKTVWADIAAKGIGFFERYLGREPNESETDFIERITNKKALPALIAAHTRHKLTGAQMSQFEIKYLEPFLPAPNDPVPLMISKLKALKQYTQLENTARIEMAQGGFTSTFFSNSEQSESGGSREGTLSGSQRLEAELRRREQEAGQ